MQIPVGVDWSVILKEIGDVLSHYFVNFKYNFPCFLNKCSISYFQKFWAVFFTLLCMLKVSFFSHRSSVSLQSNIYCSLAFLILLRIVLCNCSYRLSIRYFNSSSIRLKILMIIHHVFLVRSGFSSCSCVFYWFFNLFRSM